MSAATTLPPPTADRSVSAPRLVGIDVVRAVALIGVVVMNYNGYLNGGAGTDHDEVSGGRGGCGAIAGWLPATDRTHVDDISGELEHRLVPVPERRAEPQSQRAFRMSVAELGERGDADVADVDGGRRR